MYKNIGRLLYITEDIEADVITLASANGGQAEAVRLFWKFWWVYS